MSIISQYGSQNQQYIVGFTNLFHINTNTVNRFGVVVNSLLHSILIPATALAINGQRVIIKADGQNNGNTGAAKTLTVRLNGDGASDRTISLPPTATSVGYSIEIEIIRFSVSGAFTLRLEGKHGYPFSAAAATLTYTGVLDATGSMNNFDTLNNTVDLLISVPNAADSVSIGISQGVII